jgi:hypothetical protein
LTEKAEWIMVALVPIAHSRIPSLVFQHRTDVASSERKAYIDENTHNPHTPSSTGLFGSVAETV